MRGSRINACFAGVFSKVVWPFDGHDGASGSSAQGRLRNRRRCLQIEPLEVRHLMDAAGLASLVDPIWFQSASELSGAAHAGVAAWTAEDAIIASESDAASAGQSNLYDWIIQFDTASLAGITSVAQTTSLLVILQRLPDRGSLGAISAW